MCWLTVLFSNSFFCLLAEGNQNLYWQSGGYHVGIGILVHFILQTCPTHNIVWWTRCAFGCRSIINVRGIFYRDKSYPVLLHVCDWNSEKAVTVFRIWKVPDTFEEILNYIKVKGEFVLHNSSLFSACPWIFEVVLFLSQTQSFLGIFFVAV